MKKQIVRIVPGVVVMLGTATTFLPTGAEPPVAGGAEAHTLTQAG